MTTAEAYLKRLADEFEFFLGELWAETGASKHSPLEEVDLDIASFIADESIPKKVVLAFRGKGKTTMGTCAYTAYRQYRAVYYGETQFRVKVISKSHGFAVNAISLIREWIENVWFLQHLRPDPAKSHRDNRDSFDIGPSTRTKDPSVSAAGIDGQITGTRAHLIAADDIETLENTKTVNAREWLKESIKELTQIASFGNREILFCGTSHHRESLYDHIGSKSVTDTETGEEYKFVVRSWPIILPEPKWLTSHVAPIIRERLSDLGRDVTPGELIPTCPKNFPRALILERLAEGEVNFARQSMLVADCADLTYPLRLGDLIVPDFQIERDRGPVWVKWGRTRSGGVSNVREDLQLAGMTGDALYRQWDVSTETERWSKTVMHVDTSGRGEDQTAWGVASFLAGWIYIKCLKGAGHEKNLSGDDPRILRQIAEDARFYGATEIWIEQQFGGSSFAQLLEVEVKKLYLEPGRNKTYPEGWRCSVDTKPAKHQKEIKIIRSLSSPMSHHRVVIAEEAIRLTPDLPTKYELQYQISNLTEQSGSLTHDDKVEVLGNLVAEFGEELNISPEDVEQRFIDERIEEDLRQVYTDRGLTVARSAWNTRLI